MAKKTKLVSAVEAAYKVNDRRGIDRPTKQAGYLYPTPRSTPTKYRPRWYQVADTEKSVTTFDRLDQMKYGRSLFSSMPNLGGAVLSKNDWAVGDGWFPVFKGRNQKWGSEVASWVTEQWFPRCNVLGSNYDFRTSLYLSGIALDVDGDSLMIYTFNRDGLPQIKLVPAHRIGQRDNEEIVKDGPFAGYRIFSGIIVNDADRPIAYRILGDTEDEDKDVPAQSAHMLFEPEWADQFRGVSRIARTQTDWLDIQDIDELQKRAAKVAARYNVVHTTVSGTPEDSDVIIQDEDSVFGLVPKNSPPLEPIFDGEIMYATAGANEKIEFPNADRPSPNTEAFVSRIERRSLIALGWYYELVDPSKVGGASVRLIQDQARRSISKRKSSLNRRAKAAVGYAVAMGMKRGLIPPNTDDDWASWDFTQPAEICVDNGNEDKSDMEANKLGITSLSEIASKKGQNWLHIRDQVTSEVKDLLTRAQILSGEFKISIQDALNLLSQRTPNAQPMIQAGTPVDNNGQQQGPNETT